MSDSILEIEKKWLVEVDWMRLPEVKGSRRYLQGYPITGESEVRIRCQIAGTGRPFAGTYRLGVKQGLGYTRTEIEVDVPDDKGVQFFALAHNRIIEKVRYDLGNGYVLDKLLGRHEGIYIVEIEQNAENGPLPPLPEGVTLLSDVTEDPKWKTQQIAALGSRSSVLYRLADSLFRDGS